MADVDDDQPPERDDVTPDELCEELNKDFENLEMTEDETEILLQEALALNKRLKAELQRKSRPDGGVASSLESALSGSPLAAKPPRQGKKGGRTMLPPIKTDKGAASSGKKSSKGKKATSDRATHSAGVCC